MIPSLIESSFREQLATAFENATRLRILSPYLTMPAVDFLFQYLPIGVDTQIVVRARPQDVMSGAVDLKALNILHQSGIKCFLHRTLHGKLYQVDELQGFIGSANFTANGLRLNGYGNLELSTKVMLSPDDRHLIESVVEDAIPVTLTILDKLTQFAEDHPPPSVSPCPGWWEAILPDVVYRPEDGLYVGDLPWCHLAEDNDNVASEHDKDVFALGGSQSQMREVFVQSKLYHFVLDALKEQENKQLYFGELSFLLHNALKDDTLRYRKEIKGYVANILSYLTLLIPDVVHVDRPNYSQRLSLIE